MSNENVPNAPTPLEEVHASEGDTGASAAPQGGSVGGNVPDQFGFLPNGMPVQEFRWRYCLRDLLDESLWGIFFLILTIVVSLPAFLAPTQEDSATPENPAAVAQEAVPQNSADAAPTTDVSQTKGGEKKEPVSMLHEANCLTCTLACCVAGVWCLISFGIFVWRRAKNLPILWRGIQTVLLLCAALWFAGAAFCPRMDSLVEISAKIISVGLMLWTLLYLVWLIYQVLVRKAFVSYTLRPAPHQLAYQHGFFIQRTEHYELWDINQVDVRQNLWQRLLGVGDLELSIADQSKGNPPQQLNTGRQPIAGGLESKVRVLRGLDNPNEKKEIILRYVMFFKTKVGVPIVRN
ncbi:MAG: PH domain-containing protein [Planctomycetia bacterium]|nr:PH domain-containing protein [Planctomycetia bacterium]